MKKLIASLVLGTIAIATTAQLPRIVVQGNGAPQVFTELSAAINAAQSNDYIYLSGGTFNAPDNLVFDKPLHFVGAGMHPDSTGITGVTSIQMIWSGIPVRYTVTTAASGSSFTGIAFGGASSPFQYGTSGDDDDPTGIIFQRCSFVAGLTLSYESTTAMSSTTFDECIFINSAPTEGTAVLTRCIFSGTYSPYNFGSNSPLTMQHCLCIATGGLNYVTGGTFEDCVFYGTFYGVASNFNNCLFVASELPPGSTGSGNVFSLTANSIFVNETDGSYQFTDDLHLAAGSPGHNAATDGTDVGLYGSSSPYKPGAVPYAPHYQLANIGTATNGALQLPVSFKVAAQSH